MDKYPHINLRKKNLPAGTILKETDCILIVDFKSLSDLPKQNILAQLNNNHMTYTLYDRHLEIHNESLTQKEVGLWFTGDCLNKNIIKKIDFLAVKKHAMQFANLLRRNKEEIYQAYSTYATYKTVSDEIERSIDLLSNLDVNADFFIYQKDAIATYMPLNQLLYSFVCFALVPSYISRCVYVRYPNDAQAVFKKIDTVLQLSTIQNIEICYEGREEFIARTRNNIKAIIFTGTYENMMKVKRSYNRDLYVFYGGAGQNPVIVNSDKNLDNAVDAIIELGTYNQGQDCASPNAILVQRKLIHQISELLVNKLKKIEPFVNTYPNRKTLIMPNTKAECSIDIGKFILKNKKYCIYGGDINFVSNLIHPTVFVKDLTEGANYQELFSTVFFLQPYDTDDELLQYFQNSSYKETAMYLTIYGNLPKTIFHYLLENKIHKPTSIIFNDHLHNYEHGYKEYGGIGLKASGIIFKETIIPGPILPQREISKYL